MLVQAKLDFMRQYLFMHQFLALPLHKNHKAEEANLVTEESATVTFREDLPIPADQIQLIPVQILQQRLAITSSMSAEQHKQLSYLLGHVLNLPSLKQAEIHSRANKLGTFDIKDSKQIRNQFCRCCGFIKQEHSIPLCASFDTFPNVGLSIYLFFETIRNLMLLLIFLLLAYSAFSFFSNCYVAGVFEEKVTFSWKLYENWLRTFSLGSKKLSASASAQKMYFIEMWIGVGLVVVWSLLLFLIKYFQEKSQVMVDNETISASDFSILIENYPRNLGKVELQKQLTVYENSLEGSKRVIPPFQIEKMNMNENMEADEQEEEKMKEIREVYREMLEKFVNWVEYFQDNGAFQGLRKNRFEEYRKFQKLKKQRESVGKNLLASMFRNIRKEDNLFAFMGPSIEPEPKQIQGKNIAIVTFRSSTSKDVIVQHNTKSLVEKIRYYLRCCPSKNKLILRNPSTNESYRNVIISRAPEPEDILWQNLAFTDCQKFLRSLATYFVTLLLLSISLGIVYLLSLQQEANQSNFYLNILISLTISIVNFLIGFAIRVVTVLQKNYTATGYQTSLAVKSILAQVVNSVAVPIVANYLIEDKNLYGGNGLATQVFYLSLINSFLPPLIKIFDPYYIFLRIRSKYYRSSLKSQLLMKQNQLNDTQEYMEFENGYEYIYYINSYLFTAFFVTLQPVITLFALLGIFLMYWIHKYTLLHRAKRPIPGSDLISTAMGQSVNLGPLFFALGALCWSHFLGSSEKNKLMYFLPNIIAGSLAVLFLLFPFSLIFGECLKTNTSENLDFQQCRIYLSSEYDRMNPATMEEAIKQYENFIENFISQKNPNKRNIFAHPKKGLKQKFKEEAEADYKIQQEGVQNQFVFIDRENSGLEIVESLESEADIQDQKQNKRKFDDEFLNRKKNLLRANATRKKGNNENSVMGMIGQFGLNKEVLSGLLKIAQAKQLPQPKQSEHKKQTKRSPEVIEIPVRVRTSKQQPQHIKKSKIQAVNRTLPENLPEHPRRNLQYMNFFGTKSNLVANNYYNNRRRGRGSRNPYEGLFQ